MTADRCVKLEKMSCFSSWGRTTATNKLKH